MKCNTGIKEFSCSCKFRVFFVENAYIFLWNSLNVYSTKKEP